MGNGVLMGDGRNAIKVHMRRGDLSRHDGGIEDVSAIELLEDK